MTPEQLAAIRARAEAATPGPWMVDEGLVWDDGTGECECQWYREIRGWTDHGVQCEAGYLVLSREDAEFIAHARSDIPALVAEVERLRRTIRRAVDDLSVVKSLAQTPELMSADLSAVIQCLETALEWAHGEAVSD